jgi:DNA-binding MarR family transcriptional regulator
MVATGNDAADAGTPDGPIAYADALGFLLSQIGFAVAQGFKAAMAPLGLDPREFALLNAIATASGQPQQVLSEELAIPPSSMVGLVDSLEARGLIERRPHASDRRVRAVHLTDTGRALLLEAVGAAIAYNDRVRGGLEEEDEARLVALLRQVAAGLGIGRGVHPAMREEPC